MFFEEKEVCAPLGAFLKLRVFGSSHGPRVGAELTGLPAGAAIDCRELQEFLDRRRPGRSSLTTPRQETDIPQFLSGLVNGVTTGAPLVISLENTGQRRADYAGLQTVPRPGHADYTAWVKYGGTLDMRGGGPFSGRMTAPVCAAGGVALQLLAQRGIFVGAHLLEVGGVSDLPFPRIPDKGLFASVARKPLPVLDDGAGEAMRQAILAAKAEGDSVGGIVECAAIGLPVGLGGPLFDGVEGRLAGALFGIPAVKGAEFGAGFAAARARGSENNDPFVVENGVVQTEGNHAGGLLGGITNGMPLLVRAAFKPTPSIAKRQRTVDVARMENTTVAIAGRHDPCVALRGVPVVEAVTALILLDMRLEEEYGCD